MARAPLHSNSTILSSDGIGLQPFSPYYMLLIRNIIPEGQRSAFDAYMQGVDLNR